MADIKSLEIENIRQFTGAKSVGGSFVYYKGQKDFRFFRYSQDSSADIDAGKQKVSGIQLQTIAQCLINFFGYDQASVQFDQGLYNLDSVDKKQYVSISKLSNVIADIQNGKGNQKISGISPNLKLQMMKKYAPETFVKNKTDQEIINLQLSVIPSSVEEQAGVIGPVTYNFIVRQAIFQWFKETYLSSPNSFLYKSLPILEDSWIAQQIPRNQDYFLFISTQGLPERKFYPTIGVLFDVISGNGQSDQQLINRASQIINFLLLRKAPNSIFTIKEEPAPRINGVIRKCVYADFSEILYSGFNEVNFTSIDMVKGGLSYLASYKAKFLKGSNDSTLSTIREAISAPETTWNGLDDFIGESALYFTKSPDMQKMLLDDATFFEVTNDKADQTYTKQYDLLLPALVGAHNNYTNTLVDTIDSERVLKKNVLLRDYPADPFNEPVSFYYDKNYNLLGASITKGPNKSTVQTPAERPNFCITTANNPNLIIPPVEIKQSLLDLLSGKGDTEKYKRINLETVIFITEFFIREYGKPSQQYSNNQDLYEKIKNDIKNDLAGNQSAKQQVNKIPNKGDFFLEGDFSRIKFDYLYSFGKDSLLFRASEESKAQTQLVKLKTSNYWTVVSSEIQSSEQTLDGFLGKHFPWIEHKANEKKQPEPSVPNAQQAQSAQTGNGGIPLPPSVSPNIPQIPQEVKFERLKTDLLAIPNEIDLSTQLNIKDLLTGDCFSALFGLINQGVPKNVIDGLDKIFTIMNSLDFCYIIDLLTSLSLDELKNLLANENIDQNIKDSISRSIDNIKECLPTKPPIKKLSSPAENPDDTFRVSCLLFFQNFPKIPNLFSTDFLKVLKKIIFEFIIALIIELIIQFINKLIKGILELCKDDNTTADALLVNVAEEARELPAFPSPADFIDDEIAKKCSIVELLSANPNIAKNQIYNVTRQFFGYDDISNSEFDSFFAGLTSVLYTNEIVNIFTDNISQTLYGIIKGFSDQKDYQNFDKVFSNISTTRNFFKFLSKYVDLSPCYKKIATDKTKASFCFDPKSPTANSPLNNAQALDLANDLLKQITGLCSALSGEGIADKIFLPSLLDEQAKNAISAGANAIINTAYGNFNQMKKAFFQSYSTIQIFNKSINNQSFVALDEIKGNNFKLISPDDAIIRKIAQLSGENKAVSFTEFGQVYRDSKIFVGLPIADPTNSNIVSFDISFDAPDNNQGIIDETEKFIYDKSIISQENKKIILPATSKMIVAKETVLSRTLLTSLTEYTAQQFVEIFFDDKRFNPNLKNTNLSLAKKEKNYYYLYDNFLNDAQGSANIESLKRYIDVKNELENFLKTK